MAISKKPDTKKSFEAGEAESSSPSGDLSHTVTIPAVRKQELFLPIHGHVELYEKEIAIIDHPAFQRLRRVRQLGMAHMVFPGATHTRFEHCIGAVHVAQLMIDHVNENKRVGDDRTSRYKLLAIDEYTGRFIRLAALLHDIGHLPFGHTLEDELSHLRSHDGPDRLDRVAKIAFPSHEVDRIGGEKPVGGWTLKALINTLYEPEVKSLGITDSDAFTVLAHIVCKAPKHEPQRTEWKKTADSLKPQIFLDVCRDIVGNTICADFLDYLHRDWYHLGKPLYFDKRLYQYMEVRQRKISSAGGDDEPNFVINVRESERIRHDALTDILTLLNARYKLSETVLFHRTKLALTGLLDRCLLELSDFYDGAGISEEEFKDSAEELLLKASDDGLPLLLRELAQGSTDSSRQKIAGTLEREARELQAAVSAQASIEEGTTRGPMRTQQELIFNLIDRLRDRDVYCLAYKLRMADFTGSRAPDNPRLKELLGIYKEPKNRLKFLRMLEAICDFTRGTLIMNCPPDAKMNAKVAEVNLLVEDEVHAFHVYEGQGESSLTHGALLAQIRRFYELWGASIYVDRRVWDRLTDAEKNNLKSVLAEFFFLKPRADAKVVRAQMEPSLRVLRGKVARAGTTSADAAAYSGSKFPSGLPFDNPPTS